jgi:muramoyltetrapeptide carboxypeptidase
MVEPVLCPAALRPGDRVRVVAPSGPFDRALFWRGVGWLGARYRVELDRSVLSRAGFLAGSDDRRCQELNGALRAPGVAAILSARGGYGLTRIVDRLDLPALLEAPKWFVGFSDATTLHVALARIGIASLHAHNVCGLGRGDAVERSRWLAALEQPRACRRIEGLESWQPGHASGLLFGGNLTVLFSCAAAGRLRVPDGAVLVLEDITESAYRIDRMLTALTTAGAFDRAAAVVVGELTDCPAGPHGVPPLEVMRERLSRLGLPVLAGLRAGHGRSNLPLPFGLPARVEPGALTICPPVAGAKPASSG